MLVPLDPPLRAAANRTRTKELLEYSLRQSQDPSNVNSIRASSTVPIVGRNSLKSFLGLANNIIPWLKKEWDFRAKECSHLF